VVRLASSKVSRRHARIHVEGERATLEDLGSHNGTWWRGRRLEEPAELGDGDEIGIGDAVLIFRRVGALTSTETHKGPAPG
jgi:pSer/pThr/pTyr-binding forkhead associated (FHA) protein